MKKILYVLLCIIKQIYNSLRLDAANYEWRKKNGHNGTTVKNRFDQTVAEVGNNTYGSLNVVACSCDRKLKIGHFCSIADEVVFILEADHYTDHISTFPFKARMLGEESEAISKGDIVIDDDVWIGYNATILSGVHIGQGAVIAAGAVVAGDVPPYAVWGGVPAKHIKYRFSPEIIEKLMHVDYSKLDRETITANIDRLYEPITEESSLTWLPRKD